MAFRDQLHSVKCLNVLKPSMVALLAIREILQN